MKRLVIFADGTWNSPEKGGATNVLLMARAVSPRAPGVEQVVFYDWGVGTDRKELMGGMAGEGIDKNIQDCYRFLVHNYDEDDEIFLFGFSRGAYTVRSLGGFIRNCGLLKREHADRIPEAYKLYRKRTPASSPSEAEATAFRRDYAVADRTRITFLGVWDTVGALGIPVPFWGTLNSAEYLFHDTEPSSIIDHARHALSIDETRSDFAPTLWDEKDGIDLKQVWFAGVHSDVGGGYPEHGLSDHACAWMQRQAEGFGLVFEDHLASDLNPDFRAKQHNEDKGIYTLRESIVREISGPVHESARSRWNGDVNGYRKKCKALAKMLENNGGSWNGIEVVDD